MAKGDDVLLQILDFIELHWMAIFAIFIIFGIFMSYNIVNDVEYIKPTYKLNR